MPVTCVPLVASRYMFLPYTVALKNGSWILTSMYYHIIIPDSS